MTAFTLTGRRTVAAPDGVALAVGLHGDRGPLLLMIPGLGATQVVYDPVVPSLVERGLRVAVVDQRGVGASGVSDPPTTLAPLAADAAAVVEAVGGDAGRCHVFGASMGGMVALHLALDHPGRVDRLVLACTGPGRRGVRPEPAATEALLGRGARTPEEAYRIACTVLYEPGFAAAHPEFVEEQIRERARRPVPARVFQAQRAAAREHDVLDRLGDVAAPTLVLHGTADAVMPVANGRLLAAGIPGARAVWLEGRGHLFFHEDPAATADAVAGCLLDAGRPG